MISWDDLLYFLCVLATVLVAVPVIMGAVYVLSRTVGVGFFDGKRKSDELAEMKAKRKRDGNVRAE